MSLLPRILGAATAAYGVAALVQPRVLARPVGMVEPDGELGPEARRKSAVIAGAWSALCALSLLTTRNAR